MFLKFVPTTVRPTVEDVMQAWEGEGNKIQAVTEDVILSYKYMADMVSSAGGLDITEVLERALSEDGPFYIVNGDYDSAERLCVRLNEDLQFDIDCLVDTWREDGGLGAMEDRIAEDVIAYVKEQATKQITTKIEEEFNMNQANVNAMMKSIGLEVGQVITLGGMSVSIMGFSATDEGVQVVLNAGGNEVAVPVRDVMETVQDSKLNQPKGEVKEMNPSIKLNANVTTKIEEEVTMTNVNEVVSNEEVIAQSSAAQAFLAATQANVQKKEEAPAVKSPIAITLPSQTKTTEKKEEIKMNKESKPVVAPVASIPNVKGAVPTVTLPGAAKGATIALPGTATSSSLSEKSKKFVSAPSSDKTKATVRFNAKPWYLQDRLTRVLKTAEEIEANLVDNGDEIRLVNPELGISLISLNNLDLYNAGERKFYNEEYPLSVQLLMASDSVVVPFDIAIYGPGNKRYDNDVQYGRTIKPYPIYANNINLVQRAGVWGGELVLSTKNEKEYNVKCSCGSNNTIKGTEDVKDGNKVIQVSTTQECYKCKKPITVAEVAQDENGNSLEFKNMGWIKRSLPYGFQFSEEILAQVMAFAHLVLEDDLTHPNFIQG